MQYRGYLITGPGKKRTNNEDNFIFGSYILEEGKESASYGYTGHAGHFLPFFGVFDGMGGIDNGEVASFISASYARDHRPVLLKDTEKQMREIVDRANALVCDKMRETGTRMGSTAVMIAFSPGKYTVLNIGDSPAYLIRDGEMTPIFEEHSLKASYFDTFGEEPPRGKKFPLTQNIGVFPEEMIIEPHAEKGNVKDGDVFLLCSDGLTDMVEEDDIRDVIRSEEDLRKALNALYLKALDAGGRDNITLILVRAEG